MQNICQHFDEYCDGELDTWQQLAFEQHLPECAACREQLVAHRELEPVLPGALQQLAGGVEPLETCRVSTAYRTARRSATWQYVGRAIAAMIVVAIGITVFRSRPTMPPRSSSAPSLADEQKADLMHPVDPAIAQFPDESPLLPVQLRTRNPDITVIWFYPTANDSNL